MKKIRGSLPFVVLFLIGFVCVGLVEPAFADDGSLRIFLKTGSALAAVLGLCGAAVAGYLAGRSYDSHTGWERYTHGAGMFFNRKPFQKDQPTYEKTPDAKRLNWEESLANRMGMLGSLIHPEDGSQPKWMPDMGIDKLPQPLKGYFREHEESFKQTLKAFQLIGEQQANWKNFETRFAIADAWSNAMASSFASHDGSMRPQHFFPPDPNVPPEEWDFQGIRRDKPLPFKSPEHASQLIKKIAHTFGATLVGITKLNPDWCYQGMLRGVGPGKYEVPEHWEYAIVVVTPHEWDSMYANPVYGSSYDAYSRERMIAGNLEAFIRELGYPARAHVPPFFYDLVMPPIAVDAGLGEQGRKGLLITPELGSNARLACVTTNIPMKVDKPVDLGIQEFCSKCKICAERCPGGAISHADHPELVRGYQRWVIKSELCFNIWASVATSHPRGCRICLAVCPYTRKNNWVHAMSKNIDSRDPTGIMASMLLWVQKGLFKYPKASEFMPPPQGINATYHEPPDWLQTEKWFEVHNSKD